MDMDYPAVAELVTDVATAVGRQAAAMSEDVYKEITRGDPATGPRQAAARPARRQHRQQRGRVPADHAAPDRSGRRAGPDRGR